MRSKLDVKKWMLSAHAALRAEERKILAHEIQELLQKPDDMIPQGDKWILTKHFTARKDNLVAAVIVEKQEHEVWLVVTIMVEFVVTKP